ncbi:MAG: VOC family protein [Ekhidna sp.]|nr:VOC family protein [Ekhidna sp.]
MDNQANYSHAATVFPVKSLKQSIAFYCNKLAFEMTFSWGEPISYAVLKNGGVSIHLTKRSDNLIPSKKHCALYIFVHDIEKAYQLCIQEGVSIMNPPDSRDYLMKDFDIKDPDGYIITFGSSE